MSIRGGRGPREDIPVRAAPSDGRRQNGYQRTGRYGRGPGDQRRYDRYGDRRGSIGGPLGFALFLVILVVIVLVGLFTIARPVARLAIVPLAEDNTAALRIGFIADLVREDIGAALTNPAVGDDKPVDFVVQSGDTPVTLAPRLKEAGIITSERAFLFLARIDGLGDRLTAGQFALATNLTPAGVVKGLVDNRVTVQLVNVTFREGLRIEQMAAKLQTVTGTGVDAKAFYDLAMKPTDELLADYPWLLDTDVRPKGASLEGFLYPATYNLRVDPGGATTAEDLIRMMLDAFFKRVGQTRLDAVTSSGLHFNQVLALASIVEREAQLDSERPLIAGVYTNRLNPKKFAFGRLQSDPTIFYVNDTLKLRAMKFTNWTQYVFWNSLPDGYQLPADLPADLEPYNTYTTKGLPPGPICSPALASIDAALHPNTKTGYLYFIAKGDGSKTSAFAKTKAEHDQNVARYKK
jgi:UPF0755 protein